MTQLILKSNDKICPCTLRKIKTDELQNNSGDAKKMSTFDTYIVKRDRDSFQDPPNHLTSEDNYDFFRMEMMM